MPAMSAGGAMHGGGRRGQPGVPGASWGASRGLTLIELLAAMMVLLVGVYAVAALFPRMYRNVEEEKSRTTVMRLTEQTATRFKGGADAAPDDTAPLDANINSVDPGSRPQDPDSRSFTNNPPNSRDDMVCAYGERFTVPAASRPGSGGPGEFPCYIPKVGLINDGSVPNVVETKRMTPALADPGVPTTATRLTAGTFCLRPDGTLLASFDDSPYSAFPTPSWIELDYQWVDSSGTGLVKRVPGEAVVGGVPGGLWVWESNAPVQAVQAAGVGGRGGSVICSTATAYAVYQWSPSVTQPSNAALSPGTRNCVVDITAHQAVYFPKDATGRALRMDYLVRVVGTQQRRDLILQEDQVLPSSSPYMVHLTFGKLDNVTPLLTMTVPSGGGTPGLVTQPVNLLMVDLTDGQAYGWNDGQGAIIGLDFINGIFTVNSTVLAGRAGDRIRVYYRTMDQHMVQLEKAPAEFVETAPGGASNVPNWPHRSFQIAQSNQSPPCLVLYGFPAFCQGQAVQVDYLAGPAGGMPTRISNELHVINYMGNLGYASGYGFVLNRTDAVGVLAVRGASLTVSGWWRAQDGRVAHVDTTDMLLRDLL